MNQLHIVGIGSLTIVLLTSCFIGLVFTFQVVKEFIYLNANNLIGSVLALAFIRELCPVLTAVIVAGRIGSAFTAEIATMKVTDQIDVLYILGTDPIMYLVVPRLYACLICLPILNFIAICSSLFSGLLLSSMLYGVSASIFIASVFANIYKLDLIYSSIKSFIFGFVVALVSCIWGLNTKGGSQGVGKSTTTSVVTILLLIFMIDFVLSLFMFNSSLSIIEN